MLMKNGWTGGQYSLFRMIFGSYLFVHFIQLIPWGTEMFSNQGVLPQASLSPLIYLFPNVLALWDDPILVIVLLVAGAGLSVLFVIGLYDRGAGIALWYILACLFGRNPLIANPSLPFVGWMLLAHACLPPAPYGSWAARGRPDPGGHWRMLPSIHLVAWVLMAFGYSYSGLTKLVSPSWLDGTAFARMLENPLARPGVLREALLGLPVGMLQLTTWGLLAFELAFAPLALFGRLRPWLWSLMLMTHLGLLTLIDFADLTFGMVMLHLFTFNPAWIHARKAARTGIIFYDGHCGLCHRVVRFVLAEDRSGQAFRFAPLDSDAFRATIAESQRCTLPDSLVVRCADGSIVTRSRAVLYIMQRLGGSWRLLAALASTVPVHARDRMYDGIARIRYRLFAAVADACPLVPRHLRTRFDI